MTQIKQKTESNQSELKARLKDSIFVESHRGIPGFEAKVKEIEDKWDEGIKCLRSFGMVHRHFTWNFQQFIKSAKITKQDFEQIIDLALQNEDGHDLDYSDLLILSVYVETQTIDIWWSDFFFERYVGAQDWALDNSFGAGQTITVTAGEHLKENWKDEVKGFIMDNLHRAHIDNEEIEKL